MSIQLHHLTDRDLMAAIDGELTHRRQRAVDAHLHECDGCRERRAQMKTAASNIEHFYGCDATSAGMMSASRQKLRAAMRDTSGHSRLPVMSRSAIAKWAGACAACVAMLLMLRAVPTFRDSSAVEHDALPVSSLTPGATWNVSLAELCSTAVRPQRPVDLAVKRDVVRAYGMESVASDQYELDYLITPELGGAADARNLWPQRYGSRVWNAYVKDQLERMLPGKVCRGEVDLATAQRDIAADWVAAYKKYFETDSPIHLRAGLASSGDRGSREESGEITYPVWRPSGGPVLELVAFSRP